YGRLNIRRLAMLARIVQTRPYLRLNTSDSGDIFARDSANWDSPDIDFDPVTGNVRLWIFNPDNADVQLEIQLYTLTPTLLPLQGDWTPVGSLSITAPANDRALATIPITSPIPEANLLFAQVTTTWYDLTQETHMATYARVLRWAGHMAWKQPLL